MQVAVQPVSKKEAIRELGDIGFWRGTIPARPRWGDLEGLIRKTRKRGDTLADLTTLQGKVFSAEDSEGLLPQDDFIFIALQLLEYRSGDDFPAGAFSNFAKEAGVEAPGGWAGEDLLHAFYGLLCRKGKCGRSLLDIALANGALRSYNARRKVPAPLLFAGRALPVFPPKKAVTERVYVETDLDTDRDGKRDRIAVYIRRPAETDRGLRVPVMYIANPYAAGWNEDWYTLHKVDGDLAVKMPKNQDEAACAWKPRKNEPPAPSTPVGEERTAMRPEEFEELEESMNKLQAYLLPRGFATVFSSGIGTRRSDGIRTCGSQEETDSTIAVIEWLAGNRRAFTTREGDTEIKAWWCTGRVGMCGKSYLGTMAIAAAASGVEGLECVITESAISNWYRYYRENGLVCPALEWQGDDADLLALGCMSRSLDEEDYAKVKPVFDAQIKKMQRDQDRVTANYNAFWDERNYLKRVDGTKAAVYIVHGLNDWNVKPIQFGAYWQALQTAGVNAKMLLHQGAHIYINDSARLDYYDAINLWLTHHLWDAENGADDTLPPVLVQSNVDSALWHTGAQWPSGQTGKPYHFGAGYALTTGKPETGTACFTDDVDASGYRRKDNNLREWRDAFVAEGPGTRKDRLAFVGRALSAPLRISGVARLHLRAALDAPTGILSAMVVDYGEARRLLEETESVYQDGAVWGYGQAQDLVDFKREEAPSGYRIITRGHMNVQNREGICGAAATEPGTFYDFTLDLHPMDYTLPAGHRLGVLVYGSDIELTPRPFARTTFTVQLDACTVEIPTCEP